MCLKMLIQGCCMVTGPWDFYQDAAPDTDGHPRIPRTASIYLDNGPADENVIDDRDSYPDWFVLVPGDGDYSNFQEKQVVSSISPLVAGSEIVYCYLHDPTSGHDGMVQVDAEAQEIDWLVMADDWTNHEPEWPIMDRVQILFVPNMQWVPVAQDSAITNLFPSYLSDASCAYTGGVMRWAFTANFGAAAFQRWTIDTTGAKDYLADDPYQNYNDVNPGDPFWQYSYMFGGGYAFDPESGDNLRNVNGFYFPVGQAPQADVVIGLSYPHVAEFPPTREDFPPGTEYTAKSRVVVGALETDATYGYPLVSAGQSVFSLDKTYIACSTVDDPFGGLFYNIETQVNQFDAIRQQDTTINCIAIITYKFLADFIENEDNNWVAGTIEARTVLAFDYAHQQTELIFQYTDATEPNGGGGSYTDDRRDFYRRWKNPRMLQPTESAQGGGQRAVVFQRYPFNQDEANSIWIALGHESPGPSDLRQFRLRCFLDTSEEYSLVSRYGAGGASGNVTMDTDGPATFTLVAIAGGDADAAYVNYDSPAGPLTIDVEDLSGGHPSEDAVYDKTDNTLTVYADLTNGHNQVSDIIEIINAAGDFWAYEGLHHGDEVTASSVGTTGSDAPDRMEGGTDTPLDLTIGSYDMFVHDSSDRYYYVYRFPYRVRILRDNRWTTLYEGHGAGVPVYPSAWMIAHDGSIMNPLGSGTDRVRRDDPEIGGPPGTNAEFGTIKNSDLMPLCPALEEI